MGLLDRLKSFVPGMNAAAAPPPAPAAAPSGGGALPDPLPPKKVANKQQVVPSYLTSTATGNRLPRQDRSLASTDLARSVRSQSTLQLMSDLAHSSPDLSASMFAYLRTGIPSGFKMVAKNMDGSFNPDATTLAHQLYTRFDLFSGYGGGFTGTGSMRSNSEALAKDIWINGAMCGELVLDKGRVPLKIQPVWSPDINFIPRPDGSLFPQQQRAGQFIDLDIPTFFYVGLDQELSQPYPAPPMQSAIKPVFAGEEFNADLQRVVKRAVHPRLDIAIDEEKFLAGVPDSIKAEGTAAVIEYRNNVLTEFRTATAGLEPEDALVHFSHILATYLSNGNSSISQEWETATAIQNARMATGAKTLPSILGHAVGSSNIASTETMQFMKNAEGAITYKLNEFYSRIFTLAVRLMGQDCYVEFCYDSIDLRPQNELEPHRQTKQSRWVQLLSLGFVTDEEFSLEMTGRLPDADHEELSGTRFADVAGLSTEQADGAAGQVANPSNDGSTLNKNTGSKTGVSGRGGNSKVGGNKKTAA